ncbi:MAG TPA: hypothetical protein VIY72_08595 [Acidimicrobiales bacterium]
MKLLTFPFRLLFRLVVLPIKIVLATAGFTFRTGFKAGTLPVKGGYKATRLLGLKALVLFAAGIALGIVIGRRLGEAGAELAESYGGGFDREDRGPVVALVEDTVEIVETADGTVVSETVSVTEVEGAEAAEILEEIDEVAAELEAEAVLEEAIEKAEADGPGGADV